MAYVDLVKSEQEMFAHLNHPVGGDDDVELGQEGGVLLAVAAVVLVDLQLAPGQAVRFLELRMSEKRAELVLGSKKNA